MWERIYRMLVKEFIQVLRDPRMKALIFVMPVIQLIMFGYAVTTDVDHIKTAVGDLDKSPQSRALIERFTASGYFTVVDNTDRPERLGELLDRGKVIMGIQINRGFADDLKSGRQAAIQTIIDGTDSNTGTVAMDYAQRITQEFSRARAAPVELAQLAQEQINPIELRSRALLESMALGLLDEHLHHCLGHAATDPYQFSDKVTEASAAISRLVRS